MKKNLTPKEKEIKVAVDLVVNYYSTPQCTPQIEAQVNAIKAKYGLKNLKKFFYLSNIS